MTKFINDHVLVSGNNQGDIRMWGIEKMKESEESENVLPGLSLRYFLKAVHNGPVETAMNIGDVVITSGGNDGSLIGWCSTTGKKIGSLTCHYGQETFDETTGEKGVVKSCVIAALAVNDRLISLCRDGVLAEWKFGKQTAFV
jgi:WD40 repeat protein